MPPVNSGQEQAFLCKVTRWNWGPRWSDHSANMDVWRVVGALGGTPDPPWRPFASILYQAPGAAGPEESLSLTGEGPLLI